MEAIFKTFLLHYGTARMAANWDGQDPTDVQRYWAAKLGPISPMALRYALSNLPKHPPTVDEFLETASRYRAPQVLQPLRLGSPKDDAKGRESINAIAAKYGRKQRAIEC